MNRLAEVNARPLMMNGTRHLCRSRPLPILVLLVVLVGAGHGAGAEVSFQRDIQPILAEHCIACHGVDAATRKGRLRLDQRTTALAGGRSGTPAIVPGQPEQSELIRRVSER